MLREFTPESTWVVRPGDMLYLPPGVAHRGVAVTEGMTWSVGFLAPKREVRRRGSGAAEGHRPTP